MLLLDFIVAVGKSANSVGENMALGIFGRESDLVDFLGVDLMVLAAENIHRPVYVLLGMEAVQIVVEC